MTFDFPSYPMKPLLSFLLAFLLVIATNACNNVWKDKLVGRWLINEVEDLGKKNISADEQQMFEEAMKEMQKQSFFDFQENGIYEVKIVLMGKTSLEKGVWEIDSSGKKLYLTSQDSGSEQSMDIEFIDDTHLILTGQSTGRGIKFKLSK